MSIKAVDLNFVYGGGTAFEQHALFDVNLEIEDGEFVGLTDRTYRIGEIHPDTAFKRADKSQRRRTLLQWGEYLQPGL